MIYNNLKFDDKCRYSTGEVHDCLTGFGKQFVETGFLRGYGYVDGGKTGFFGKKAAGGAYVKLREALRRKDLFAIVEAAKKLPTVSVRIDITRPGNANYGFKVSRQGCLLFVAPYLGKA